MRALLALLLLASAGLADAANAYYTVYKERPPVTYQAATTPALLETSFSFTNASSVQSAAFPYLSALLRIQCDVVCHVSVGGTNPTATATTTRLQARQTEYFLIIAGDKFAVIAE